MVNMKGKKIRQKGKVVFTNGTFDLLHPGHIKVLKFAKSLGDKLIVGINSDKTIKILKCKDRPVNNQADRKIILESLRFVDKVVIFNELRTGDVVKKIKPDVVVKGYEGYTPDQVRKIDGLPEDIEIKFCPHLGNYSTTNIIKKTRYH